jgi:BNR/Asp-box repeat
VTRIFTRPRVVAAAFVAAFVAAFAALGAVSKSSPVAAGVTAAAPVPYTPWYWTMVVSSSDPNVLVLATSSGLYRSADAAKTWHKTGPQGVNMTSVVDSGTSMFAGGVPGPNPVIRKGAGRTAPDGQGVLVQSTDGGKKWRIVHPKGLPNTTIQALAVDPAKTTALYALLNNGKLFRSSDGGRSFELVSPKIDAPPWALAVTRGGHLVAGDMDRGGFLSTDGKAWQRTPFTDSSGGKMVMEYAVQPTDAARVLMTSVGILMSTDGGKTWQLALKSKVMFGPVAWAPSAADVAYAIGFDRSFWRSGDAGKTWAKVS